MPIYELTNDDPLHFAAANGDIGTIKKILSEGKISIDTIGTRYRVTALAFACEYGHEHIVELLLQQGAKVDMGGLRLRRCALDHAKKYPAIAAKIFPLTKKMVDDYQPDSKHKDADEAKIALLAFSLADYFFAQNNLDEANYYFTKAKALTNGLTTNKEISSALNCRLAQYYLLQNNFTEARIALILVCKDYTQTKDPFFYGFALCEIMTYYRWNSVAEFSDILKIALEGFSLEQNQREFLFVLLSIINKIAKEVSFTYLSGCANFYRYLFHVYKKLSIDNASILFFEENLKKIGDEIEFIDSASQQLRMTFAEKRNANTLVNVFCNYIAIFKNRNDRWTIKNMNGYIEAITQFFNVKQSHEQHQQMLIEYERLFDPIIFLDDKKNVILIVNQLTLFLKNFADEFKKKKPPKPTQLLWANTIFLYLTYLEIFLNHKNVHTYDALLKEYLNRYINLMSINLSQVSVSSITNIELDRIISQLKYCLRLDGERDILPITNKVWLSQVLTIYLSKAFPIFEYDKWISNESYFISAIRQLKYDLTYQLNEEINRDAMDFTIRLNTSAYFQELTRSEKYAADICILLSDLLIWIKTPKDMSKLNQKFFKDSIQNLLIVSEKIAIAYQKIINYSKALYYYSLHLQLSKIAENLNLMKIATHQMLSYLHTLATNTLTTNQAEQFKPMFELVWNSFKETEAFGSMVLLIPHLISLSSRSNDNNFLEDSLRFLLKHQKKIIAEKLSTEERKNIHEELYKVATYLKQQPSWSSWGDRIRDILVLANEMIIKIDLTLIAKSTDLLITTEHELTLLYLQQNELEKASHYSDDVLSHVEDYTFQNPDKENEIIKTSATINAQLARRKLEEKQPALAIDLYETAINQYASIKEFDTCSSLVLEKIHARIALAQRYVNNGKWEKASGQYEVAIEELATLPTTIQPSNLPHELQQKFQETTHEIEKQNSSNIISIISVPTFQSLTENKPTEEIITSQFNPSLKTNQNEKKKNKRKKQHNKNVTPLQSSENTTLIPSFFKPGMRVGTAMHGKFLNEEGSTLYPVLDENAHDLKKLKKYNPERYKRFKSIILKGIICPTEFGHNGMKYLGGSAWEAKLRGRDRISGHTEKDTNENNFVVFDNYESTGFGHSKK